MTKITRRDLLGQSAVLAAASGTRFASHGFGAESGFSPEQKLKLVVVGGHPDDPESGCGGTIALHTSLGHEVTILYLTRGEAGIEGKSHQEAATIRTAESEKACSLLGARPLFAGQIDGDTELNRARYADFSKILDNEHPDIVLTQWPVDTHRDHRAASLLTYDAWLESGKKFALYYYEVDQGEQTQIFHPTHYIDITQTESRKRAACDAHASQQPETSFYVLHDMMNRFRGMECGVKFAEAFVRHNTGVPRQSL